MAQNLDMRSALLPAPYVLGVCVLGATNICLESSIHDVDRHFIYFQVF